MKRNVTVVMLVLVMALSVGAQESQESQDGPGRGVRIGTQLDTTGVAGVVARLSSLEVGLKLQATLYDTAAEDTSLPSRLLLGAHVVYLFGDPASSLRFGGGADVRTAFGTEEVEYDEYLDIGLRLTVDQFLGSRVYVTGILFPFWVETRDVSEVESDWQLVATIPRGGIAFTFLF
jgi:hypothetical protein